MRGIKLFGTGLLTVCMLMLAVLPVSGASATKAPKLLRLTEDGGTRTAPAEAGAAAGVFVDPTSGCDIESGGHLTRNSAKTVTMVTTGAEVEVVCNSPNESESGGITEVSLSAKGKVKIKAHLDITEPSGCEYIFTRFKPGKLAIPGLAQTEGTVNGKWAKGASKSCAKSVTEKFVVSLIGTTEYEIFETELVS